MDNIIIVNNGRIPSWMLSSNLFSFGFEVIVEMNTSCSRHTYVIHAVAGMSLILWTGVHA